MAASQKFGNGSNRYQFVHADDLADVCILAGAKPGPDVFNAGTDRFGTMRESLEALCAHAGTGSHVRSLPAGPSLGCQADIVGSAWSWPSAVNIRHIKRLILTEPDGAYV